MRAIHHTEHKLLVIAVEKMTDYEIALNSKETRTPTVKWMSPGLVEHLNRSTGQTPSGADSSAASAQNDEKRLG